MSLLVSVVMPTYKRNDLLERCLARLADQDLPAEQFEVVVADDAGDPMTEALVNEFDAAGPTAFRYVSVGPTHGPAAARNAGWRCASGEVIAFTDDDCLPEPTWLRLGLAALKSSGADAAAGQVVVPLPERPTDYERDCAGLSRGEFVTANCFCRRSSLEAIGGFDEQFKAAWREDSDLQFTLLEQGYTIVRAPEAVIVHPVRPACWGVSLSQQKKTQFNALLYRKHPRLYRERIEPMPWSYYAAAGALAAGAIGGALGVMPVAAASIGCWTAITGWFCTRRLKGASRAPAHLAEMMVTSALIPPLSLYWHARGMLRERVVYR